MPGAGLCVPAWKLPLKQPVIPIPGEHPGQVGTPKVAPTSFPGSSSLNKDEIKRARPGGGQEHPATLDRSGTMSRLSVPARAGSWRPNEAGDDKRVAWERQKLCPLLMRQPPVKSPLCCMGITPAAPKGGRYLLRGDAQRWE